MREQGFRGNCDSQGKLGMCPSLAEPISSGFSKSHVSHETIRNPLQLFPRNSCKITAYCFRETRRGGLVRPPRKAVAFLTTRSVCQKYGTGISLPAACFRNTTRIRFGKAGAHPQLALGIAIVPETLSFITTF